MSVTDLTFAAAVHGSSIPWPCKPPAITFESTLDDITTVDLTATTTRFEGDLTGLGGLTVAGTTNFATASTPWRPPSLPEPWCWRRIWN
ncbi:MAG: hypothetical protein R3C12_19315 [Planctomycetaceae bacterium]